MILKGILAIEVSIGWRELEEYLNTTEKYLQKAKTDFEARFDEQVKSLPPEERDEFSEFHSETYWDYAETFPTVLRNSFLVSACSLLEYKMALICKWLKKDKQIPISWSDLQGDELDRFKLYCRLTGLDLLFDDRIWQEIKHYSKVRNCIVHSNGLIEKFKSDKDFMRYITRKNIISKELIREQIALTEQFCRDITKTIWKFLSRVLEAYESQRQKQKSDN